MEHLMPLSGPSRGKAVLLVPRWSEKGAGDVQGVPFRSFVLAAALLEAGFQVVLVDQESDLDRAGRWKDLAPHLRDGRAAFLWMNEMYPYRQTVNALDLAAGIRAEAPETPVIAGGEFISVCPPRFFDFESPLDYFVRGYGEDACLGLLEALEKGESPARVPGVAGKDREGRFFANEPRRRGIFSEGVLDLYRRIDLSEYIQRGGIFGNGEPTLTVGTGRGCVKNCRFCVWSGRPARVLPARAAVRLIRDLRERYGVRQFHIGELDFFLGPVRVRRFAELMARMAPGCYWFALGSPSDMIRLRESDWDALYEGGLRKVEIGIESGSDRLLRKLGKRHTASECLELVRLLNRRGIHTMSNFLFGFPGETREDRRASLELIERIWSLSRERNVLTFRYFQPSWDTPLGKEAWAEVKDPPRTLPEYLEGRLAFFSPGARFMPWLGREEEEEIRELVDHLLPLATSKLALAGPLRRGIYRFLRSRAERRLRRREPGRAWERRAYRLLVREPLDSTYVP